MEEIGVFRAPFVPSHTRDDYLENIISSVQAKMPEPEVELDDRPLSQLMENEGDIGSGHRIT